MSAETAANMTESELATLTNELVDRLVDSLREGFRNPNWYNITNCVVSGMEFVGPMKGLSGAQKKMVVIQAVTRFVDETDMMGTLEPFVLGTLPVVIENVISADKHRLTLNPRIESMAVRLGRKMRCCA